MALTSGRTWLTIYALLVAMFALRRCEKLRTDRFNHWNEALSSRCLCKPYAWQAY
jgi:hypothetical protein